MSRTLRASPLACAVLAVGLPWLAGCTNAPQARPVPAEPVRGGVLRMVQEAPQTLDPWRSASVYDSLPISQIFDTLVAYDPSLNVVPRLAETWTISRDSREYTFFLRPAVRFHNGDPLTANDVVYSISRQLMPNHAGISLAFSYLMTIDGAPEYSRGQTDHVRGLEIVDARTVKFRLARPYPSFLELLAMENLAVVPERVVRQVGTFEFGRKPVGTGPFSLADWDDDGITLAANRDHFHGAPYLDGVRIAFLRPDENDYGAARFLDSQLDVLEPPTESLDLLAVDDSVTLHRYQELSVSFLGLNTEVAPLDDRSVRRAIAHALNRQAMVDDSPSVRREAVGILPPGLPGYSPEPKALDYNPERARRLLAQAGYPEGRGLPVIPLHTASQSKAAIRLLRQVESDLGAVGIRLDVVPVSWSELGAHLDEGTAGAFLLAWIADLTDPDSFLRSMFEPDGSGNYFGHLSDETNQLLEAGIREFDPVARARIYRRLEAQILQEAPLVPLYHSIGVIAVRDHVEGFHPTPLGVAKVELERVWIRPADAPS
ncbi:MAG TPA: ABC transporter substrate-binding protein [Candidatus Polarisedimenticolaceae bacterium]|nr:ABC transporter substrate-binding protein [Candidatus Polarisedimenticolaceae bacterium]